MADFFSTGSQTNEAPTIRNMKRVKNGETGLRMYHVFMSDGEFYAAACNDVTDAAFDEWLASPHTAEDDAAFIEAINFASSENAYESCANVVNARLERVTDRISTDGIHVYFDNDSLGRIGIDPVLEDHLVKLMALRASDPEADYNFKCYAAFCELLYSNVDPRIRSQFVRWLTKQEWLTFTEDGRIIGYRGAQMMDGVPCSIHQGPAIVDGKYVNGHVPNPDGAVVEMPRSMVQNDPSEGCAPGLHVGTYDYARSWAHDVILTVKVDPRDVVSVPFDCGASKIRVCRFEVIEHKVVAGMGDNLREYYEHPLSHGFDPDCYGEGDEDGYDEDGYDEDGYDEDGYDEDGYDVDGYDRDGYDRNGYDSDGYDEYGYDRDGYDRDGYDANGVPRGYDADAASADEDGAGLDGGFDDDGEGGDGAYHALVREYSDFLNRR